jgi:hypothetical protein
MKLISFYYKSERTLIVTLLCLLIATWHVFSSLSLGVWACVFVLAIWQALHSALRAALPRFAPTGEKVIVISTKPPEETNS